MNEDAVKILSKLLLDAAPPSGSPSPLSAAGAGARQVKRLLWTSGTSDSWTSGRAAQGFLLYNDGLADAFVAQNSAGLVGGNGAILTVKAGTWIALPIVSSVIYVGGDNDDGTLLLLAFDFAPTPAAGVIFAGTPSPDAQLSAIDDASSAVNALHRNPDRREAIIANATGDVLYVGYCDEGLLTTTSYTIAIPDGGTLVIDNYTGDMSVLAAAGAVTAGIQVTEIASRP